MASSIQKRFRGKVRDDYLALIIRYPLSSITSDEELSQARDMLDQLLMKRKLSSGETLYLDALSDLVGTYEQVHHPLASASDADILRHFIEARGVTQSDVYKETGIPKSSISEVLSGKKQLTRQMINKLADYFSVDKGILAQNL